MSSSDINHNDLQIGQVLYIVSDKQTRVIPVVVSEQATIRTLEGNSTTWKVIIGPKNKRKTYPLNSITGEKFFSLSDAKEALLSRFTNFLNETIDSSAKTTKDWYGIELEANLNQKQTPRTLQEDGENFDPESLLDSIESSTETSISQSPRNQSANVVQSMSEEIRLLPTDSPELRRAKLRAMAKVDNDEEPETGDGSISAKKVVLPGGEEVTVILPNT